MPIYEYQCDGCADRFEIKQSMKDEPITACPKCGKHVQRLISSPAIMFKGSGWYVTDYSDKMKPSSGSEAPAPKTGEKKEVAASTSDSSSGTTAPPRPSGSPPSGGAGKRPVEHDVNRLNKHSDEHAIVFHRQVSSGRRVMLARSLGRCFLFGGSLLRDLCGRLRCARLQNCGF